MHILNYTCVCMYALPPFSCLSACLCGSEDGFRGTTNVAARCHPGCPGEAGQVDAEDCEGNGGGGPRRAEGQDGSVRQTDSLPFSTKIPTPEGWESLLCEKQLVLTYPFLGKAGRAYGGFAGCGVEGDFHTPGFAGIGPHRARSCGWQF